VHVSDCTEIPSLDGPVLQALAATTAPLTLTRVHQAARDGSLQGVRKVLLRLVDTGLVHAVPGGYVLNRDHIAAPAVEVLAGLYGELHRRLREAVRAWGGSFELLALYGSAARRDGDQASDIDVLLISDDLHAQAFALDVADRVRRWTGNAAHVLALNGADLRRMRRAKEPLLESWQRDLIVVAGDVGALRAAP
jgi:predicted nucleotidyltransferase